ncbi:MAG: nucleotidyl transferase AbiEii/AbiGii toxin family protein [Betaproteobacteria bacterium]
MYSRPRHATVASVLSALNSEFLGRSKCFFGGGTRVVLELKEYRESADIDLLCSDQQGYRAVRSAITNTSLGEIASQPITLAREVRADQYGMRTVVKVGEELIKFEIIREGRIDLGGMSVKDIHVPCLDRKCCFAEKILANDDRWIDESVLNRDIIDLAYMIEAWGPGLFLDGMSLAHRAYGDTVLKSIRSAAQKLMEKKTYYRKCVEGLRVTRTSKLLSGLKRITSSDWSRQMRPAATR